MCLQPFEFVGSSNWTRTSDQAINSRLLYQLSYRGILSNSGAYNIDRLKARQLLFMPIMQIFLPLILSTHFAL